MNEMISKQLIFGRIVDDKQVSTTSMNVKADSSSTSLKNVGESIKTLLNGEYNLNSKSIFSLDGSGDGVIVPPVEDDREEEIIPRTEFDKESDWNLTLNDDGEVILNKLIATSLNPMNRSVENIIIPSSINMSDGSVKNVVKAISIDNEPLINNILSQKAKVVTFKEGITEVQGSVISSLIVEQIIFADTITSLDDRAVSGCYNVKYIKYPKEYVTLPNNQFESSKMTEFIVSENITKIGEKTFSKAKIEKITLNNVENISNSAFENCKNLAEIDLRKVKIINYSAFSSCESLTEVNLESIERLIGRAFANCINLSRVVLGRNLTILQQDTFINVPSLKEITIPNSVITVEEEIFGRGTTKLDKIYVVAPNPNVFNKIKADKYHGAEVIYISEEGEILPNPSEEYVWGEYYPIEDEIDQITDYTDDYTQWKYEEDTENEGCVILGNMSQAKMDYYENNYGEIEQMLIIPNKLKMADGSIKNIKRVKSDISYLGAYYTRIIVCEGIEDVLEGGLDGLWVYNKIKFPTTLKTVGKGGFNGIECPMIDFVNIESLGERALRLIESEKVKMTNVKTLAKNCFVDGKAKSVIFKDIESIGEECFKDNKKLQSFEFNTIGNIGKNAFENCIGLTGKLSLEGVTSMEIGCFRGCKGITSVNIGSTLRHLPENFFYGCSVEEIVIPSTITSAHEYSVDYDRVQKIYVVAPNKAIYDKFEYYLGDFVDIKYVNEDLEEVPVV